MQIYQVVPFFHFPEQNFLICLILSASAFNDRPKDLYKNSNALPLTYFLLLPFNTLFTDNIPSKFV
jgi:hypothetical protein